MKIKYDLSYKHVAGVGPLPHITLDLDFTIEEKPILMEVLEEIKTATIIKRKNENNSKN